MKLGIWNRESGMDAARALHDAFPSITAMSLATTLFCHSPFPIPHSRTSNE